jgi:hypothetical protein
LFIKRRLLIEQLCQRQVMANVAGVVFEDANLSLRPDAGDTLLPSRIVYLDANNNGQLDENETLALTDDSGRFELQDLTGDESIIRLFNGSSSSSATTFPIIADVGGGEISVTDAIAITSFREEQAVVLATNSISKVDFTSREAVSVALPFAARAAEVLPDGRILVLGSDDNDNQAFTVDTDGTVTGLNLQSPSPIGGWADVAIDASGNGVLVEQADDETILRAIAVGDSIVVGSTSTSVGAGTKVFGGGELTTIISTPTDDGIRLRLWSNATGTEIGNGGVEIPGGQEVLSYDDASGLVLLRTATESITVLDVDAGFASLQTINDVSGPAAIDAVQELLFSVSPGDGEIRIVDLRTANLLGSFALDANTIQSASQLAFDSASGKLLLLTSVGVMAISLDRTSAHRYRTTEDSPVYDLLFAVETTGDNTAPQFETIPTLTTFEDTALSIPSPEFLASAFDADGDQIAVLLSSPAENGLVVVTHTGGLGYIPDENFFGSDFFSVILHDGRAASDPIEIRINVTPVADPIDFTVVANIIPENALASFIAAEMQVFNVDGGEIVFSVDDSRFTVQNGQLLTTTGSQFDFDTEPSVLVNITATNSSTEQSVSKPITLSIEDVQELDIDIQPDFATIDENRVGELIAEIFVLDDGAGNEYAFSVDDDRFEISFRDLKLKPGVSLDYETEPVVVVNVTAMSSTGATKTEPITITVLDIPEQVSSIDLSRKEVIELVHGAVVGDVIVDGRAVNSGFLVSVDDSRFEVIEGQVKLRSSEFVRRADQQEIEIVVTVQDSGATFLPVASTFVIDVLVNPNPFHNESNPYDVNADGQVNPLDALLIINSISRNGGPGPISQFPSPDRFYDVNGDGLITALDALLIINFINRRQRGEGEMLAPPANDSVHTTERPSESIAEPVAELAPLPSGRPASAAPSSDANSDLQKLRDVVLEMLEADELSDKGELDEAIRQFSQSQIDP